MKFFVKLIVLSIILASCSRGGQSASKENTGIHEIKVEEVLNAGAYTYIKAKEGNKEEWLAVGKMEVDVGDILYYESGMTMTDFESEGLERTFESIIFVDKLSKDKNTFGNEGMPQDMVAQHHATNLKTSKLDVEIEKVDGGITIGELYTNKSKYDGKKVTIRGKVTKFNEAIMNTNWIHIQDGTEYEGKFDLTIKSAEIVSEGDVITLEGSIALDVDLGHGYEYEILMEDAKLK